MNIQTKRAVLFGFAHFLALIVCFSTAFTLSMERFDKVDENESAVEFVAVSLTNILMTPGRYIWTPWASKNLHNSFEWMLFIANSALWGVILAYIYGRFKKPT